MSKLYKTYMILKEKDSDKIYMFKSGMFYVFLQEDAKKISEIFGFKITKLNEQVVKCGFPSSRLEYYLDLLQKRNLSFEIVDDNYTKIENYEDYMNNDKLKNIIKEIGTIDLDNISFREAYDLLVKIQTSINQIYKNI